MRGRIQRTKIGCFLILIVVVCAPWSAVIRLCRPSGTDISDSAIWQSGVGASFAWAIGAWAAIQSYRRGRVEPRPWLKLRRGVWTAGCIFTLIHVALAMHAGHGWSHAAAYRHTAEAGGFGAGVYVNYLFAAVWLADAAWMWAAPTAYRHRPRWVGVAVHGFLAFIVFNATVVFGTTPLVRVVSLLFTAALAWQLVRKWAKA